MTFTRRLAMAGGVAAAALAGRLHADAGARREVQAALDAAAATRDPAAALRLLAGFDTDRLDGSARLDLITARAGLETDILIAGRGADPRAVSRLDGDVGLYELILRRKLGNHQGLAVIERQLSTAQDQATAAALRLFDKLGIGGATVGARFATLWRDPRWRYADTDAGRDRAVADMNAVLAPLKRRVAATVGAVPPWCLDVAASRGSAADQAAGRVGTRILPTPASSGAYVVDLTRIGDRPRWTLPSVVAHELVPGHMIQMPMEAIAAPHALRLAYAPAYPESWGIFAEWLVATQGAWRRDPLAMLGFLHWHLFRLGRARADIGLNCRGWDIAAAQRQLTDWQGPPAYFAPFDRDLPRIANEPGTRLAEMLGAMAMAASLPAGGAGRRYLHALLVDGRMRNEEIIYRSVRFG